MNKLWTRDFTIITLGTVVSMLGNAVSGFAIGLMVLDYTKSVFLYALFMVMGNLPKIIMPLLAGPYLDRFSRKKAIYILDFISAALYLGIFFILSAGYFNYYVFLLVCFIIGSIDGIYAVAYDSLYPTLIAEGNYRRAYSISSMIYPLAAMMVPVAAFVYDKFGLTPMFLFNAISFFIAAVMETRIKAPETHIKTQTAVHRQSFRKDFSDGLKYIKSQPALMVVTAYFTINALTSAAEGTLIMPYFKANLSVLAFAFVGATGVFGRLIGGAIHYKFKYPAHKKFNIALFVYTAISVIIATYLYTPVWLMLPLQFLVGIMGVTSFNIRISATQNFVPNEYRGRFNGTFQMLCTAGSITGQLICGALGDVFPIRAIVTVSMLINICAVYFIMYRGRQSVKPLYNRDV